MVYCKVVLYLYTFWSLRVGDVFEGGAGGGQKASALRKELGDLERAEKSLDELIQSSTAQLRQLTENKDSQRYPLHTFTTQNTHLPLLWIWSHYEYPHSHHCRYHP